MIRALIVLPLPPRDLQPNRKPATQRGRLYRAALAKSYRETAGWSAVPHRKQFEGCYELVIGATIFHPGARNKLDDDNALGWLKSAFDGLQDGLKMNDRKFRRSIPEQKVSADNPRVVFEIEGIK